MTAESGDPWPGLEAGAVESDAAGSEPGVSDAATGQELADDDVLLLDDQELVLPVWEPTGEYRVDAALDLLDQLDPDDVHQHAAVFAEIHQRLHATLTDLDTPA